MGDIFEDRLEKSLKEIRERQAVPNVADKVKVSPEHHFVGFDAYKKVLASDIDIVMLATPPGYRPEHFAAAVEAKKHIFAEKPFGTDPVGVRKIMAATEKARQLKLTVMSGAQRRNQKEYVETWQKVKDGAIGDIVAAYAYWVGTPVLQFESATWPGPKGKRDPKWGDMTWQHRTGTRSCGSAATRSWSSTCTISTSATGSWARIRPRCGRPAALSGVRAKRCTATSTITSTPTSSIPTASTCPATAGSIRAASYGKIAELLVGTKGRTNCARPRRQSGGTAGQSLRPRAHRHGEEHPRHRPVH